MSYIFYGFTLFCFIEVGIICVRAIQYIRLNQELFESYQNLLREGSLTKEEYEKKIKSLLKHRAPSSPLKYIGYMIGQKIWDFNYKKENKTDVEDNVEDIGWGEPELKYLKQLSQQI